MDRRRFLATGAVAISTPLVGCLDAPSNAGDTSPERPWVRTDPVENPEGAHHLFVENLTETTEAAWLRVTSDATETIVDGRYELPDQRGIKFERIARWETTYTIDIAMDGEDVVSVEWVTAGCGQESAASDGSRNASVRVMEQSSDDDRVELLIDQCDAIYAPVVPTGPAEYFRQDE